MMEDLVYLRAFEISDLGLINQWHNDKEINILTGGHKYFISTEYDRKWLEDKMINNTSQVYCAICKKDDNVMIGFTSLNSINLINRNAFWGGILIGDQSNRSKGYANQAAILLLKYGFFELGLNKISGKWLLDNNVSIFMGKMLGFKQEGILKEEIFKNNKYNDVLLMSIFKAEFEKNVNEF